MITGNTGISAFCGLWGSGKTLLLAEECMRYQKQGVAIYSNFGFEGAVPIETMDDLMAVVAEPGRRRRHIAIDEAGMLWPAREYNKFPAALNIIFMQGRKFGISLSYTSQSFEFVDTNIRRVTGVVCNCRGHGRVRISEKGDPKEYRPKFFSRAWYLGESYGTGKAQRLAFGIHRFKPEIGASYDTYALVTTAQRVLSAQIAELAKQPRVVVVAGAV